jgi:hypothetical protein
VIQTRSKIWIFEREYKGKFGRATIPLAKGVIFSGTSTVHVKGEILIANHLIGSKPIDRQQRTDVRMHPTEQNSLNHIRGYDTAMRHRVNNTLHSISEIWFIETWNNYLTPLSPLARSFNACLAESSLPIWTNWTPIVLG